MAARNNTIANMLLRLGASVSSMLPGGRKTHARSILVVRLGNLGDIVVALPAFHALKRLFPESRLTLLTSPTRRGLPGAAEVLANDTTFGETITYYADQAGTPEFLQALKKRTQELAVDLVVALPNQLTELHNLAKFLAFFASCGVRRFAGFQLVTTATREVRQVDRLMHIVNTLGSAPLEPVPWLHPSASDQAYAETLLAPAAGRPIVGMQCGAKRPANRWSPDSFAEVARRVIKENGVCIALTGGPGDRELVSQVAKQVGPECLDLAGETTIAELAAVAQRCRAFVSNDTGVMHVAYAVGTPTVAIFSARYYPNVWYPCGEDHIVLRKDVECRICEQDICPLYEYPKCLELIAPDEVLSAVQRALDRTQGANR